MSVDITEFLPSPHALPRLTSKKCECLETGDKGERGMIGSSTERGECWEVNASDRERSRQSSAVVIN